MPNTDQIVTHEDTNVGHDRTQPRHSATQAQELIGDRPLTVLAERGYVLKRRYPAVRPGRHRDTGAEALTSTSKAEGRFDKRDCIYDAARDEYRCPAGERAIWRFTTVETGSPCRKYWSAACPRCPMRRDCTTSKYRRVGRWEHEHVLETMQARLDRTPESARRRRQTVEHPFATLKSWMGDTHFQTKTVPKVQTEMSLHVLAYKLKRAISIL